MYAKIVGCICIVLASAGYGYSQGMEYKRYVEEVEYLCRLIRQMAGEMSYTKAPLAEVCIRMKNRVRQPYETWLFHLAEEMEKRGGMNLAFLWSKMAEEYLKELSLEKEEWEELKNLGSQMGYLDIRMQEDTLLWYAGKLEERQKILSAELAEKRRLCNLLGVTGGIFLVILLL